MNIYPLRELIENRGFDKYQSGLASRFMTYKLEYKLVYCEPTSKSAMYLDFESPTQLGRVTVWVSGECDMAVMNKNNGERVFGKTYHFNTEKEFFEGYPKLVLFMREHVNA